VSLTPFTIVVLLTDRSVAFVRLVPRGHAEKTGRHTWYLSLNFLCGLPTLLYLLCMPSYDRFIVGPMRLDLRNTLEVSLEEGCAEA
jgi:hypothetical protein